MLRMETRGRVVLIGGGARSGKSRFALERARSLGTRRIFVATAQAFDDEMRDRIARHQIDRGSDFQTIEEPCDLVGALRSAEGRAEVVLVDCLTLWISNLLLADRDDDAILAEVEALAQYLTRCPQHVVLVTNEVGMGVVPESALGRRFRDLAGSAHQRLVRVADEVHLAAMGMVLRLRPPPIEAQWSPFGGR
jgi:adenosylcobinamide kinase/adenosylcobinamide-phosphate guanylyltransferase